MRKRFYRIIEWDGPDQSVIKNITEVAADTMFTKLGISRGITRVLANICDRTEDYDQHVTFTTLWRDV